MLAIWSPKGGSGTSVVSAALALTLAHRGGCRLADLAGDQPAVLGMAVEPPAGVADWLAAGADVPAGALDRLAVEASPGLALLPRGGPLPAVTAGAGQRLAIALRAGAPGVADLGTAEHPAAVELGAAAGALVVVLRPCYLALRRSVAHELLEATLGAVVVDEPGRSLRPRDVARVIDRPVLAVVRAEARVARAVDAGLLAVRLPDCLGRMAVRVLPLLDTAPQDEPGPEPPPEQKAA